MAQDVTQTVFIDLARTASSLSTEVQLGGWLHRHTCFVASKVMRGERRRRARELQAIEMNSQKSNSEGGFEGIGPALDEAIDRLKEKDRAAILLRFIERQDLHAVGVALGISENAAQKRIGRALEILREAFHKRGITISAAALSVLLSEATNAAPAGLSNSIAGSAFAAFVTFHANKTLTLFETLAMNKLKVTLIGAVAVAAIATPLALQRKSVLELHDENRKLQQVPAQLFAAQKENEQLSNAVVRAGNSQAVPEEMLAELLRLRGELARLRRLNTELEQVRQTAAQKPPTFPNEWYFVGGGGIAQPGRRQFDQGLTVTKAVQACGGLTCPPDKLIVELTHDGATNKLRIDLVAIEKGTAVDPAILPHDKLSLVIAPQ